jgi:hypothetical protein
MNDTVVTRTHPFIASALGKMRLSQQAQPGGRLRMYERGEHLGRRNATGNSTLLAQAADEEGRHYAQARAPHCHRHSTHTATGTAHTRDRTRTYTCHCPPHSTHM